MQATNASTTPEFDQATNILTVAPAALPSTAAEPEPPVIAQATPVPPTPPGVGTPASPPPATRVFPPYQRLSTQPSEAAGTTGGGVTTTHVVLRGENFTIIGKKYGVSSRAIAKANPRVDARTLKVGDKLVIPAAPPPSAPAVSPGALLATAEGTVYVVKSGDNLSTIAKHFGTSVGALRTANSLKTDKLKVGDKLKIPAAVHADSSTSSPPRFP